MDVTGNECKGNANGLALSRPMPLPEIDGNQPVKPFFTSPDGLRQLFCLQLASICQDYEGLRDQLAEARSATMGFDVTGGWSRCPEPGQA